MDVVIYRARIQREELFEATAIQWHILDLSLVDQARSGTQRRIYERPLFRPFSPLRAAPPLQRQIHYSFLPHNQSDPPTHLRLEAGQIRSEFIWPHGQEWQIVSAVLAADRVAGKPAVQVLDG